MGNAARHVGVTTDALTGCCPPYAPDAFLPLSLQVECRSSTCYIFYLKAPLQFAPLQSTFSLRGLFPPAGSRGAGSGLWDALCAQPSELALRLAFPSAALSGRRPHGTCHSASPAPGPPRLGCHHVKPIYFRTIIRIPTLAAFVFVYLAEHTPT